MNARVADAMAEAWLQKLLENRLARKLQKVALKSDGKGLQKLRKNRLEHDSKGSRTYSGTLLLY